MDPQLSHMKKKGWDIMVVPISGILGRGDRYRGESLSVSSAIRLRHADTV